jgi:hypothetical protein
MALRAIWQFCVFPPPRCRREHILRQRGGLDTVPPLRPTLREQEGADYGKNHLCPVGQ